MTLVRLTDSSGDSVWIGPTWVQRVRVPSSYNCPDGSKTEITLSGGIQFVRERMEDVVAILDATVPPS